MGLRSAIDHVRFAVWAAVLRARLRRLGCDLHLEVAAPPRLRGLPHVDLDPLGPEPRGSLTLRVGRRVTVGRDLVLHLWTGTHGTLELGDEAVLEDRIRLQPRGGAIRIGPRAQVRDACELKSKGELEVGERSILGRNVTVHCHERIVLRRHVGLAERVTVADSDHVHDGSDVFFMEQPVVSEPVEVGENAFLGTNVVVLRGARIGPGAVAAAGAVVTAGDHPAGWLLVGAPARAAKPLAAAAHADV